MLYVAFYRLKMLAASPLTLLLMLLAPAMVLLAISAVASPRQAAIPVAVVDQDRTEYSRLLVQRLQGRSILRVTLLDEAEAVRLVQTRRLEAALVIEPGLQEAILAGQSEGRIRVVKSPASMVAEMAAEYLASEVVRLQANTLAAGRVVAAYEARGLGRDGLWQEAWTYADSFWEPEPLMRIDYQEMQAGRPVSDQASPAVPLTLYGLVASLVLFNTLLTAGSLIDERRSGVLLRLRTTHVGPGRYLGGTALAAALTGA
ncbi:MAG: ABC transporter permease, partial [Bacillota bacterium]